MLSSPSSPAIAGLQSILIALVLLALGYLLVRALFGERLGRIACLGLALPGLMTYALLLMLVHIGTGGALFSHPTAVRLLTAATLAAVSLCAYRRRIPAEGGWHPALVAGAAFLLWCIPVFLINPLNFGVDTRLHMGWTAQLLNGETTPSAGITGDIPNYYPWLFHATSALVTTLLPGTRVFASQAPVQILQTLGLVLALFSLGWELTRKLRGGWFAALFGGLAGGFGWVIARGPAVVIEIRGDSLLYGGDLLPRRSPNLAFQSLAPVYPRDIGYVLVVAVIAAVLAGRRKNDLGLYFLGGFVVGLAGLTGGEAFIFGGAMAFFLALLPGPTTRIRRLVVTLAPAIALALLWYAPLVASYLDLGGFVNSAFPPVSLAWHGYVVAFGVTLPFALLGIYMTRFGRNERALPASILMVAAVAFLGLVSLLPSLLGEGFTTLGRQHRYWPFVYLGLAAFAVLGADRLLDEVKSKATALALVAGTAVLAAASPLLGSLGVVEDLPPDDFFAEALSGDETNLLEVLASDPGTSCVIAVPERLTEETFAYTGHRHVLHDVSPEDLNRARIRWRDIYDSIPADEERVADNRVLIKGREGWANIADKYAVDLVVVAPEDASAAAFEGIETVDAQLGDEEWVVVVRDTCDAS